MNIGNVSMVKAVAEEATETASQTKAEAAKGDQQAIRKLRQQQAVESPQSNQPATATTQAHKGLLDVKA